MDKQKLQHKPALGKGLASLLPPAGSPLQNTQGLMGSNNSQSTQTPDSNRDRHPGISMCSVDEIHANIYQPRTSFHDETIDELSQSIKANGLIQPLIVRKTNEGYQLIAGERRLRAAKLAGLKQVPIVIRRTTDKEALELALVENLQREDLNCLETAIAYAKLMQEFNLNQEELAAKMGKERSSVANQLRLLRLPTSIQDKLKNNLLTYGHGKALAGLDDTARMEKLADESVEKKWSVRELELRIQQIKNLLQGLADSASEVKEVDPLALRLRTMSKDMGAKLATKVSVKGDGTKGKIVIEYYSGQDLERVFEQVLRT